MPEVVLVPGKNILTEAGGHATYSRAMALAARRAGFTPHLFCLGPREEVIETELGRAGSSATDRARGCGADSSRSTRGPSDADWMSSWRREPDHSSSTALAPLA